MGEKRRGIYSEIEDRPKLRSLLSSAMSPSSMLLICLVALAGEVGGQSYDLMAPTWNPQGNTPDGCKKCSEDYPCYSVQEKKCFARDEFDKCPWSYDSQGAEGHSLKTMLCDDTDFNWSINENAWALDDKYLATEKSGEKYAIEPTAGRETPAPTPEPEGYSVVMLCLSVFSICCLVIIYMAYFNYKKRNEAGPGPQLKPVVTEASL